MKKKYIHTYKLNQLNVRQMSSVQVFKLIKLISQSRIMWESRLFQMHAVLHACRVPSLYFQKLSVDEVRFSEASSPLALYVWFRPWNPVDYILVVYRATILKRLLETDMVSYAKFFFNSTATDFKPPAYFVGCTTDRNLSGSIWSAYATEIKSFNCMTLSRWPRHEIDIS